MLFSPLHPNTPTLLGLICPALTLTLASGATAQSLIVPDSTVRTVVSISAVDGALQAAGFMDLDDGAIPTNRPYQGAMVGNELWFTDDILRRITRWNRFGSTQLGMIDLSPHRLRGIATGFGSVWVGAGDPALPVPDFLVELTPAGTLVAMHPMPGMVSGVEVLGNQLLVSILDFDNLILVDPATGQVSGTFHQSNGVSGIDSPGDLDVLPNGHVLAASGLPPAGIFEYDAQGTEVNYIDTSTLGGGGGVRGVHALTNGDIAFTTGTSVFRYVTATGQFEVIQPSLIAYFFTEVPTIPIGSTTCSGVPNSTGVASTVNGVGSNVLADGAVRLSVQELPFATVGYFLVSTTPGLVVNPGGSQGTLCLGGSIGRYVQQIGFSGNDGFFSITIDTSTIPQPNGSVPVQVGETWFFQCWYRDMNPNSTSNFSDATAITFQ